ncbi:5-formyltetrahydrofolate cyclo-ligase [Sphingobacterium sp. SGR-19]|uniref:5-formyltetrahydrofolate cyclo-ligase n=1 Tax=Sphingobacterium sp. SGR-19 TaxID=2710886 RepID=UPI0013EC57CF|nr:5-formyltetrahydrofolate cyclo-ligase [Sphingobacterium sp. SGR-19]NGM66170.1 5-formyltetrahydrofolate cyclo-ligase [Sphingobacterium sp. SGR-19]
MTKAELRRNYKRKRSLLSEAQISLFNAGILNQLLQFDWNGNHYVHTFLPIVGQNEPDMWSFITNTRIYYPDIHIVVSRSELKDRSMKHFLLADNVVLEENVWGIVEPVDGETVAETLLDVVLVPLLVVDKAGNRIGYGKGFYDRFLAKCRSDCQKIGVSLFEPVEKIDDVDPLDVPLDMVITPYSAIPFSR